MVGCILFCGRMLTHAEKSALRTRLVCSFFFSVFFFCVASACLSPDDTDAVAAVAAGISELQPHQLCSALCRWFFVVAFLSFRLWLQNHSSSKRKKMQRRIEDINFISLCSGVISCWAVHVALLQAYDNNCSNPELINTQSVCFFTHRRRWTKNTHTHVMETDIAPRSSPRRRRKKIEVVCGAFPSAFPFPRHPGFLLRCEYGKGNQLLRCCWAVCRNFEVRRPERTQIYTHVATFLETKSQLLREK